VVQDVAVMIKVLKSETKSTALKSGRKPNEQRKMQPSLGVSHQSSHESIRNRVSPFDPKEKIVVEPPFVASNSDRHVASNSDRHVANNSDRQHRNRSRVSGTDHGNSKTRISNRSNVRHNISSERTRN